MTAYKLRKEELHAMLGMYVALIFEEERRRKARRRTRREARKRARRRR